MGKHNYTYEIEGLEGQTFDLQSVFLPSASGWLAEEAAEDLYNEHDGWEWSWPATVTVFSDGHCLGRFIVHMEMTPRFSAFLPAVSEAA